MSGLGVGLDVGTENGTVILGKAQSEASLPGTGCGLGLDCGGPMR